MGEVRFRSGEDELGGHLAAPAGDGPFPGVVVLHEAFGLTDDVRAHADRFAGEGYLALAPDLYSWGPTPRCLVATMRAALRGEGRAFEHVQAARDLLAGRGDATGRVGVVGFCMGGGLALLAAPSGAFAAAAPNYPQVPKQPERVLDGACPVVASFGARDRMLRGHADRLEAALDALGVAHDVAEYPEASHSFMNRHRGATAALDRVTGYGYRPEEAEDAWRRILDFFGEHLRA